jgi:ribonuclease HI
MFAVEPAAAPRRGYYILKTDGGMANNGHRTEGDPAEPAAIGGILSVLRNRREHEIGRFARSIGDATHNVAEYSALIEGLELALSKGAAFIRIYSDSEFMVDQINGCSQVRQKHLLPLHEKAEQLLARFANHRISWIPRGWNTDVDDLVRSVLYG